MAAAGVRTKAVLLGVKESNGKRESNGGLAGVRCQLETTVEEFILAYIFSTSLLNK